MSPERTRSEYRLKLAPGQFEPAVDGVRTLTDADRAGLGALMLDAYRNTIDDEGETMVEALQAVDHLLTHCLREHSFVLHDDAARPRAISFVLMARGVHYIDPVAVATPDKGKGLGRRMVETSLASAAHAGITEMGATITDGNEPSERLFAGLGATLVGPWPPTEGN